MERIVLLGTQVRCSFADPTQAEVEFTWRIVDSALRGVPQRLELSFLAHDFSSSAGGILVPLEAGVERHLYRGRLASQTRYHWRISTAAAGPERWEPSGIASFDAPSCAIGDRVEG